jgi:hypothetical protein
MEKVWGAFFVIGQRVNVRVRGASPKQLEEDAMKLLIKLGHQVLSVTLVAEAAAAFLPFAAALSGEKTKRPT